MSDFAASFYASGNSMSQGNSITASTASNNNNINNNNSSNHYPSTCNGKAVVTTDGILIIKVFFKYKFHK